MNDVSHGSTTRNAHTIEITTEDAIAVGEEARRRGQSAAPSNTPKPSKRLYLVVHGSQRGGYPYKRNEPCPCGSGKKFKACHLVSEGRTG